MAESSVSSSTAEALCAGWCDAAVRVCTSRAVARTARRAAGMDVAVVAGASLAWVLVAALA